MAKFYGVFGYASQVETSPGVWVEKITEKSHYAELTRRSYRSESSGNLNDNINISNEVSIIADPYACQNSHFIRYVVINGAKWKVSSVDISQRPRLILSLGGVYNG
jgi:hypothetical protein